MASDDVTVAGSGPVADFMVKYPEAATAIRLRVEADGKDYIYFLFAANGSWACNLPIGFQIQHSLGYDVIAAEYCLSEHSKRPAGTTSAVVKFKDADGTIKFHYAWFTAKSKVEDHVLPNADDDAQISTEHKAFYRKRVDVSYNTGAPGIVGVINLRFSVLARECIDNMPDDLYCPHGDNQFELALTLIEQAKDAAVKAVILTKQSEAATNKQ